MNTNKKKTEMMNVVVEKRKNRWTVSKIANEKKIKIILLITQYFNYKLEIVEHKRIF